MTYTKKDLKKLKKRIKKAEKRYDEIKDQVAKEDLEELKAEIKLGKKVYKKQHKKYKKDMCKGGIACLGLMGVGAAAGIGIYTGCKKHHSHENEGACDSFRI